MRPPATHWCLHSPLRPAPAPLQDGTITKKNSPSRNLHRLMTSLSFISAIFENLAKGQQLREAVSGARVQAEGGRHSAGGPGPGSSDPAALEAGDAPGLCPAAAASHAALHSPVGPPSRLQTRTTRRWR